MLTQLYEIVQKLNGALWKNSKGRPQLRGVATERERSKNVGGRYTTSVLEHPKPEDTQCLDEHRENVFFARLLKIHDSETR